MSLCKIFDPEKKVNSIKTFWVFMRANQLKPPKNQGTWTQHQWKRGMASELYNHTIKMMRGTSYNNWRLFALSLNSFIMVDTCCYLCLGVKVAPGRVWVWEEEGPSNYRVGGPLPSQGQVRSPPLPSVGWCSAHDHTNDPIRHLPIPLDFLCPGTEYSLETSRRERSVGEE